MKDIVAFDVETTGLNPQKDYIIQLAMIKLDAQTLEVKEQKKCYINPDGDYEISPQAFEKHGLTKEFLKQNGVNLKGVGQKIVDFFDNCDILTYNGNGFDVYFLYSNLKAVGIDFNIDDRIFYDAFLMYKSLHPSTLEAVYEYYTGNKLEGAHDAFNDVRATIEVFKHLHQSPYEKNPLNTNWEGLTRDEMKKMEENKLYSPEKSINVRLLDDDQLITFAMGKYKEEEFMSVCKKDPQYIKWFFDNVATIYTKRVLKEYYLKHKTKE